METILFMLEAHLILLREAVLLAVTMDRVNRGVPVVEGVLVVVDQVHSLMRAGLVILLLLLQVREIMEESVRGVKQVLSKVEGAAAERVLLEEQGTLLLDMRVLEETVQLILLQDRLSQEQVVEEEEATQAPHLEVVVVAAVEQVRAVVVPAQPGLVV